jgi:hypothetical protein
MCQLAPRYVEETVTSESSDTAIMLALTNSVPGREADFNTWYDEVHIKDLVAVPGIVAAQRYLVVPSTDGADPPYQYLTIYRTEGSAESVRANLAASRDRRVISDALAPGGAMWTFQPMGPRVTP